MQKRVEGFVEAERPIYPPPPRPATGDWEEQPSGRGRLLPSRMRGAVFSVGEKLLFHTDGEPMDIVAWHPDSDTGLCDDNHPMVNRTLVEGVSAAGLEGIRTA